MDNKTEKTLFSGKVQKMPDGYYSGDKPNPNLNTFVKKHRIPFDPANDDYVVQRFSEAIHIGNRRSPINDLHIYWSKKPLDAVQKYINHYVKGGSLVLDPFAGSGGTLLCALRHGCSAIAIDISPAATFITRHYCTPFDIDEFEAAYRQVVERTKETIDWLYEARSTHGDRATISYTVWSQVFQCSKCLVFVPLSQCVEVPAFNKDGSPRKTRTGEQATQVVCPHCYEKGYRQIIDTSSERFGRVPIKNSILIKGRTKNIRQHKHYPFPVDIRLKKSSVDLECILAACKTKQERFELNRLIEIRDSAIPFSYPTTMMMNSSNKQWGVLWRAGVADFRSVDEVFEKRALWALASYFDAIKKVKCSDGIRESLLGVMSSSLWNCSRMYREREKGGGPQEGVYYLPPLSREVNVANVIEGKKKTFVLANQEINASIRSTNLIISTQSATDLGDIPDNSIDYIFTDPPYSWKVPYGELNFLWESFLNFDTHWHGDEVIISEIRGINEDEWANKLKKAFKECFRVIKPGRCLTLCYHDSAEGTWGLIQDILSESGFVAEVTDSALSIATGQKSLKQLTSGKITQRDLIINFRKPKVGEAKGEICITFKEDSKTFSEKICSIVLDYLEAHPGATKDRIYDEVVSHMVRAGRMEAHDFEGLLKQVAEEMKEPIKKTLFENEDPNLFGIHEISRWYLKETKFIEVDAAESAKEDAAAEKVEKSISKKLKDQPWLEGVHYSDIFEHYIYSVKDKPRRQLAEWLLDYFYKTDSGTYRLPQSEEEKRLKAEGRSKGTQRRIKRFIAYLQQGVAIPFGEQPNDATLAEWLRYCKRSSLYEQGKLLYEKGGLTLDNLSEEAMVNAGEDYQVCVRMLARTDDGHKKEKRRK